MAQTPGPRATRRVAGEGALYWREFIVANPTALVSLLEWIESEKSLVLRHMADPATALEQVPSLRGEYHVLLRLEHFVQAPLREEEAQNAFKARTEGREIQQPTIDSGTRRGDGRVRFIGER